MYIKITQPGWETFSGDFSGVVFVDGVSKTHISHREAMGLGAMIAVVELDEDGNHGNPVNPAWDLARDASIRAAVEPKLQTLKEYEREQAAKASAAGAVVEKSGTVGYTREALEEIATEKGIGGIREISDPLNIKGTSIRGLIEQILLQKKAA
jgi:hypothetical protein